MQSKLVLSLCLALDTTLDPQSCDKNQEHIACWRLLHPMYRLTTIQDPESMLLSRHMTA